MQGNHPIGGQYTAHLSGAILPFLNTNNFFGLGGGRRAFKAVVRGAFSVAIKGVGGSPKKEVPLKLCKI